jgi:uncharacterized protein (TIGR02246 family)
VGHVEILTWGRDIPEEDRQAVLRLLTEVDRAWNRRDPEAYAVPFYEDAGFRFHDGLWIEGRDAIRGFGVPAVSERRDTEWTTSPI